MLIIYITHFSRYDSLDVFWQWNNKDSGLAWRQSGKIVRGCHLAFDFIFKRYTLNVLSARWTYLLESSGFLKIDKKFAKLEDFKVDHSEKTTKFNDNRQKSSNLLYDFPCKNHGFGNLVVFLSGQLWSVLTLRFFLSIFKNPEDSRTYVQCADKTFTVYYLKMKPNAKVHPPYDLCTLSSRQSMDFERNTSSESYERMSDAGILFLRIILRKMHLSEEQSSSL